MLDTRTRASVNVRPRPLAQRTGKEQEKESKKGERGEEGEGGRGEGRRVRGRREREGGKGRKWERGEREGERRGGEVCDLILADLDILGCFNDLASMRLESCLLGCVGPLHSLLGYSSGLVAHFADGVLRLGYSTAHFVGSCPPFPS